MDFGFLQQYYMFYLNGTKSTVMLAAFTVLLGVMLGMILALMKISKNPILKFISSAYIEFIRGTPLLVQLFIIY